MILKSPAKSQFKIQKKKQTNKTKQNKTKQKQNKKGLLLL